MQYHDLTLRSQIVKSQHRDVNHYCHRDSTRSRFTTEVYRIEATGMTVIQYAGGPKALNSSNIHRSAKTI